MIRQDPGSLSAGMVSAILRDRQGRLWVGTANGLDQLDEKTGKFIHYRNEPGNSASLSSNVVRAIYEDRKGVLWIGTGFEFNFGSYKSAEDGGLNRMDQNGKFTRFLHDPNDPNSLINNKVRSIFEDSRGVFWMGTSGDGLHTMDREKGIFERHTYNPAQPKQLSRPPLKGESFGIRSLLSGRMPVGRSGLELIFRESTDMIPAQKKLPTMNPVMVIRIKAVGQLMSPAMGFYG